MYSEYCELILYFLYSLKKSELPDIDLDKEGTHYLTIRVKQNFFADEEFTRELAFVGLDGYLVSVEQGAYTLLITWKGNIQNARETEARRQAKIDGLGSSDSD